jgi:hypothetical protein
MRRKLTCVMFLSAPIIVAAICTAKAPATPAWGFTATTLALGRFGEIDVFNRQFIPPDNPGESERVRHFWISMQKTKGLSDLYVQSNAWQPGGSTGWHSHPGHSLIIVTAGTAGRQIDSVCAQSSHAL